MSDSYGLIILIGALALIAWALYGQLMKEPGAPLADKLAMISQAVAAAEQTIRGKGQGAARLEHAMSLIHEWYPDMDVGEAQMHVEAAVYWLNQHSPQIIEVTQLPRTGHGGTGGDDDDDNAREILAGWGGLD